MGQIVRRRKKGRPSKADLARRNSQPPSPVSPGREPRRSCRRRNFRYNFDIDDYIDDDEFYEDDDGQDVKRREKKLRLLLGEDNDTGLTRRVSHARAASTSSSDYDDDDDDDRKPSKKRKIDGEVGGEDDDDNEIEEVRGRKVEHGEEEEETGEAADSVPGTPSDPANGVPLPDKKTLDLILDKLQKKDIYGVYAEPVDPEELPDYHDVIKHPMDFATVRKKLAKGTYLTLEQFEHDVLLICSNAMQYNAPDTIYYKQASSIQELAKRKFQRLRINVDCSEIELKLEQKPTPSFSLPKKQLKKPMVWSMQQEPVGSDFSSGATLATTGEFQIGSSAQATSGRLGGIDGLVAENSSLMDNNLDKGEEYQPGKGFVARPGRKPSVHDENRRATYDISIQPVTESESVFSTFEGESKQFVPVGLHADHSYGRSLARFAATLGSVAWKVASKRIEQALPEGFKFGRGWVGEYEPLPTPVLLLENCTLKEPAFLARFPSTTNVRNGQKASKIPVSSNNKASRNSLLRNEKASDTPVHDKEVDSRGNTQKLPLFASTGSGTNTMAPIKQESPRGASLDVRPPFFSSSRAKPSQFASSNHQQQKLQSVPSEFSSSHLQPQKPQSRNSIEPEKKSSPWVELNYPPSPSQTSAADFVATRQICNSADNSSPRPAVTVSRNRNILPSAPTKQLNSNNDGFVSGELSNGRPTTVGLEGNRMVTTSSSNVVPNHMNQQLENNFLRRQEQQGLSDPVQMMKMLAEKAKHQHTYSNCSTVGPKREDSNSVAVTAAHAWMSLGGAAGVIKSSTAENINSNKQQISADSLYNPACDFHQPQVSRFRGEFPVPGIHLQPDKNGYSQAVHAFVPQSIRPMNDSQFQGRPIGFPQLLAADLSRFQVQSNWRGVTPQMHHPRPKQQDSRPPDLNIGYQSLGSPVRQQSSGMLVDSQQPDLALQL